MHVRVRFVVDLAKAEQLNLFGRAPSSPWVSVKQFVRKDGAIVNAHQRKHKPGQGKADEHEPPQGKPTEKDREASKAAAEDYPAAGFDYDALVMRGEFKPGSTSLERMERELTPGGATPQEQARAKELASDFLRKNWPKLRSAKTVEEVSAALDQFDTEVGGKLYEEEQARRAAADQELVAAVGRTAAHRAATDPGRVASEEQGKAWAAGGAHPDPVFHATLSGSAVMTTGLKSRRELHRDTGKRVEALGAGPEDTVSTTPNEASARKIAGVFGALAEAQTNPEAVRAWFDEHWLPLVPEAHREHVRREVEAADRDPNPLAGIRRRINNVSYFAGYAHPNVLVPSLLSTPKPGELKDIGYVKAYAHVDAVVNDRMITAGPGAGSREHGLEERTMREQAETGPAHNPSSRYGKHLHRAYVAWDTRNKAEQGERRFTSNTLTTVGFVPVTDWRKELAP